MKFSGQSIRVHDPAKGTRIKRVWCLRCGERHNAWPIKCECKPLWFCALYHRHDLCKQQQCIYCVGGRYPSKRYPKLLNIQRPVTATATLALLRENENRFLDKIKKIRKFLQ